VWYNVPLDNSLHGSFVLEDKAVLVDVCSCTSGRAIMGTPFLGLVSFVSIEVVGLRLVLDFWARSNLLVRDIAHPRGPKSTEGCTGAWYGYHDAAMPATRHGRLTRAGADLLRALAHIHSVAQVASTIGGVPVALWSLRYEERSGRGLEGCTRAGRRCHDAEMLATRRLLAKSIVQGPELSRVSGDIHGVAQGASMTSNFVALRCNKELKTSRRAFQARGTSAAKQR